MLILEILEVLILRTKCDMLFLRLVLENRYSEFSRGKRALPENRVRDESWGEVGMCASLESF